MMTTTKNREMSPLESILAAVYPSITMELLDLLCVRANALFLIRLYIAVALIQMMR